METPKTLVDEVLEFLDRHGEAGKAAILSTAASINGKKGGKKKVLRLCPYGCGEVYGARDMKTHMPQCKAKPL